MKSFPIVTCSNLLSLKETSVADLYLTFCDTSNIMGEIQVTASQLCHLHMPVTKQFTDN